MPIRKSRQARTKVTHTEAHSVIAEIHIYDLESRVRLLVHTYADLAARNAGGTTIDEDEIFVGGADYTTYFADTVLDNPRTSPLSQGYAYLKTLAEFAGGEDE